MSGRLSNKDVDSINQGLYEDALANGETWAEESYAVRSGEVCAWCGGAPDEPALNSRDETCTCKCHRFPASGRSAVPATEEYKTRLYTEMVDALVAEQNRLKVKALRTETIVTVCRDVALKHIEGAVAIIERMETQHVKFGLVGSDEETHPDWCRECRVDALKDLLREVMGYTDLDSLGGSDLADRIEAALAATNEEPT